MSSLRGGDGEEFEMSNDEQAAMDILRNDGFGLGTQEAVGLQQALFSTFDNTNHATRAPERDIYDLPSSPVSTQHEPSSSPVRSPTEIRVIDLVSEGSPSRAASSSDVIPYSQQSDHEEGEEDETQVAERATNDAVVGLDASTNTGIDLKEFTLFRKLPAEIRVMIWKATIQPRLVIVRDTKRTRDYRTGKSSKYRSDDYLFSTTPIPGTLFANRESRQTMVSCGYELNFSRTPLLVSRTPRVWYNNKYDILYLAPLEPGAQTLYPQARVDWWASLDQKIKRIAVALQPSYFGTSSESRLLSWYDEIGYPEEVLIVEDHSGCFPLDGGFQLRQSLHDQWTYLPIEEAVIAEGRFPKGSSLETKFPSSKFISGDDGTRSVGNFFQKRISEIQDLFAKEDEKRRGKGHLELGAPKSISYVMVMKTSQAEAIRRAREKLSRESKELNDSKQEVEKIQLQIEESKRRLKELKGKAKEGEIRIKTAEKSVEKSLLTFFNLE